MKPKLDNLRNEKFTFSTLIGVMLLSLVYISMYTLSMKDKVDSFRQDIQSVQQEMKLLLEFIPVKDSVIVTQKNQIITQMEKIQFELSKNELSEQQRNKLMNNLKQLKEQIYILQSQAKKSAEIHEVAATEYNQVQYVVYEKDTLVQAQKKEIARLNNIIKDLQNQKANVIVHNKLSVYYLTAVSQDKRNRASRTNYIHIQFQLKGDIASVQNKYLYIEVRDPSHSIISTERDKIRITNQYITDYRFEPSKHKFMKGKYSIRVYSPDSDFQSVTFFTLI